MKIYINEQFEIKAIYKSEDISLREIEIDRTEIFGDKSDFMILNYCYQPSDNGYSVYPSIDYNTIKMLDTQIANKISILEQNNQELREELNQIQTSIAALITTTIEK